MLHLTYYVRLKVNPILWNQQEEKEHFCFIHLSIEYMFALEFYVFEGVVMQLEQQWPQYTAVKIHVSRGIASLNIELSFVH